MKTSVRFLAVLFALIMAMFTVAYAADYSDVNASNANYDAIELLSSLGVLNGYDDGTFRPDDKVQRDEMAKMIYIMATSFTDAGEGVKLFPDVSANHWAAGFITWAHGMGIVNGYEDGTFRPDDNITYDEALKMAATMLGYVDFNPELWPQDVRTVALTQLDLGDNIPDTVEGETAITRAQAAQIVYNTFYKTMAYTKTITYYEKGFYDVDDPTQAADREVKVEVAKTLAEDVWNCNVYNYKIVATERYAVNDKANFLENNSKTGKDDQIKVVRVKAEGGYELNGNNEAIVETIKLKSFGLDEYIGNTDSIIGFTLSKITKDGEDFAISGIKGVKYEGLSLSKVAAKATDANTWVSGTTYWFADRLSVNGTVYTEDDFWNLRAVYVDSASTTDPVFNVMHMPIAFADKFSNAETVGTTVQHVWETPVGTFIPDKDKPYKNQEVHFNSYLLDYNKRVWGVDSEGDGVIDYIFLKNTQPFRVTNVLDFVNNGKKSQQITVVDIYNTQLTWTFLKENVMFAGDLKKDDILVGANFGNKLYVSSVVQPQTSYVTGITGSVKMNGIGNLTIGGAFVPHPAANVKSQIVDVSDVGYWLNKNADGTRNMLTVWVYGNCMIWSSAAVGEEKTAYDKAILLYVDKKTDKQIDKTTNKVTYFYPAYLLIDGKEEAVNLNPLNAIDELSGDYVSADGSPFRATTNPDGTLGNVYALVTYEKDSKGYYTLKTVNTDLEDKDGNTLEKIIPVSDYPVLEYNATTGYYKITTYTDDTYTTVKETYPTVDVSEKTYLYYNYTKESTGDYKYIGFYTSDHFGNEFKDIKFASAVYLTYNEDDGFYTLQSAILGDKMETVGGEDGVVSVDKDGRIIYMATAKSAYVLAGDEVCYEHYLMNPATGEIITVVQDKKSVADNALALEAGKFYAWDAYEEDYVRVTAAGATTAVATLDKYTIATINTGRDIITTTTGEYADGIKLTEIPMFAFDNEYNRYEINVSDIEQFSDIAAELSLTIDIIFVTYEDENGDMQIAYAVVDYAERVYKLDGTVEPKVHTDVCDLLAG